MDARDVYWNEIGAQDAQDVLDFCGDCNIQDMQHFVDTDISEDEDDVRREPTEG